MSSSSTRGRAYPWLEPSSVRTDGKYRVTTEGKIRLVHMDGRGEISLEIEGHDELVDMVQAVKRENGEPGAGVFYLNEWRHVLVKAGGGTWFAGRYGRALDFPYDGRVLTAAATYDLSPGDIWTGPRVGIRYTLAAAGDDVYCKLPIGRRAEQEERLSDYLPDAAEVVTEWARHKPGGGRVCINEARELFSPSAGGSFVYLGRVPLDSWFPEPLVDDDVQPSAYAA